MPTFSYPSIHTYLCLSYTPSDHRNLHSFPTRRSSDLEELRVTGAVGQVEPNAAAVEVADDRHHPDRKSTRLNSSHLGISYAVFCLKKKNYNADEAVLVHCMIKYRSRLDAKKATLHHDD